MKIECYNRKKKMKVSCCFSHVCVCVVELIACKLIYTAYKNATREQKLELELSAAKKERDFYLAKVDQSRALSSIDERLKKV